jgi:ABC-type uncharacterized transport system ATPase subunit
MTKETRRSDAAPLLSLSGVTVRFGAVVANDAVDLSVGAGEIHALLGENGAGKTTLMRVVAGLVQPQAGAIAIEGRAVQLSSPIEAAALGIGMVHQHFMLIPTLSVAQNVCLGLSRAGRFFPNLLEVARELGKIAARFGLQVDPHAIVGELSVEGQQRVEIVKALYRGARILILDEPTAVLAPQEVEGLFNVLRILAEAGAAIVFISHKLNEAMAISERSTVLRQGRVVAALRTADTNATEVARLMIGEDLDLPVVTDAPAVGAPVVLDVADLVCGDKRRNKRIDSASFVVHAGEIVGVAGVEGNGQQELAEALVGLRPPTGGRIRFDGVDVTAATTGRRIALGLAHVPEDRLRTALVDLSIGDNAAMETIGRAPFAQRGFLSHQAIRDFASRLIRDYDIRCTGPEQRVATLSGGNQQKVVLGRALARDPRLIVAVQPTRGLDVGATAFVHAQLLRQRKRGAAIVLISTELDEILSLADRILVMFAGRIVGSLARDAVTLDRLGAMMTGQAA